MKQYNESELKVGIVVKKEQLSGVYGVWIYFDNYTKSGGKIICISREHVSDEVRAAVRNNGNKVSVFYQDSYYEV